MNRIRLVVLVVLLGLGLFLVQLLPLTSAPPSEAYAVGLPTAAEPAAPAQAKPKAPGDVSLLDTGGPDAFGYTYVDSDELPCGPTFNWEDISTTGITLTDIAPDFVDVPTLHDVYWITTTGFTFNFYGTDYITVAVSSDGYLNFDNGTADFDAIDAWNQCLIPDASPPNNAIYGFWNDFDLSSAGEIYVERKGTAPHRRFIVQYHDVPFASPPLETVRFQVILFEGSNDILMQYDDVEQDDRASGWNATEGLEGPGGTTGLQYEACGASGTGNLHNGLAVLYSHLTVNDTGDAPDLTPGDGVCDTTGTGICTLRAAIMEANAISGTNTINFNITGAGPHTIQPLSPLPVITDTVIIDGYTQTDAEPATAGSNADLRIVLDGSNAGPRVNGLEFKTDNSKVCGLNIHSFEVTDLGNNDSEGNGIVIRQGMTNTIAGNFIGTNVTGTTCVGAGNGGSGVVIGGGFDSTAGADRNTVGGTDPADRNVITCNGFQAITVTSGSGVTIWANFHYTDSIVYSADSNTVLGNYIGTDINGATVPLIGTDIYTLTHSGNTGAGVRIVGGQANTVGGTDPEDRNILSGNELDGVRIEAVAFDDPPTLTRAANDNVVQGNYIGTDVTGIADLGNVNAGVHICGLVDDADNNLIGGTTDTTPGGNCTGACNTISGNGASGVMILGGQASDNTVQGNYIGTNRAGDTAIPNDGDGITITDAEDNTIGGTTPEERNLVSGNGAHGISIVNSPKMWVPLTSTETGEVSFQVWGDGEASGNIIQGNYIGTKVNGTEALQNALSGVLIMDAAGNTVGGATPGERNLISGNGANGVLIVNAHPPGNTETDVVTAEGTDAGSNPVSGSDSATVTITDPAGAITVTKTADPTHVDAVGDTVTFTIRITNTSGVEVMIKRLSGWLHGSLHGQGTCRVPQILANGGFYTCTFSSPVYGFGPGPNSETDTVTASGTDVNGNFVIDSDSATVTIGDLPSLRVTKTANPTSMASGGTVNFTVEVENISGGTVTIDKLWDTQHGDLDGQGSCSLPVNNLLDNTSYVCSFSATVSGATGNTVEGNYIGTDVNGTYSIPNQTAGVVIGSPDNMIGGATAAHGNLISGNVREGVILLGADTTGNSLRHNLIGTRADGASVLGNGFHGVLLEAYPSDNAIGSSTGMSNTIAYNGRDGVLVVSGLGNQILSNSIFTNTELGIDLGKDNAVTPNDDDDPDAGANTLQNYPVLTSASAAVNPVIIQGVLNSTPGTQFTIQFFANTVCDPSGFGEGATYLGSDTTGTDGFGNATINTPITGDLTDQFITATATDPYSNTSEFSNCIPVPSAPALGINKEVRDLNGGDVEPGDRLRYTIHYSNTGNAPATGVVITDTYSTHCVTRTNVTDGDFADHDDDGIRIHWPITDGIVLDAQASGSVGYYCTLPVTFTVADSYVVTNTATLDSGQTDPDCTGEAGETPEDPTDGCDMEEVTVTVAPVLTIDKECTPATGNSPGDTVHCVIQYANNGDANATDATIVDDYDQSKVSAVLIITDSVHFVASINNGDTITWDGTVTIPVGESGQVEYNYELEGADVFPFGTSPVTNTATINSVEAGAGPVQDGETIQVLDTTAPVLTIDKQVQDDDGGLAEPGDVLHYTINYANTGTAPASGVFITDDYSDLCAITILPGTMDANFPSVNNDGDRLRWPVAPLTTTLGIGVSGSLSFDCTLQDSFPAGTTRVTNTCTIDSDETDPEQDTATLATVTCFDFNGDGVVDVVDIMEVASRWNATLGDPNYQARCDLNGDGCITVVDIMMVSAQWGQTCP